MGSTGDDEVAALVGRYRAAASPLRAFLKELHGRYQPLREGKVADRVTFIQGDLFAADLSAATVVAIWLSNSVNMRLEGKLRRELAPGARIVSHQFPIGTWAPDRKVHVEDKDLFLWTIPPR